jgi:thiamine biosynthesis lipoprotein
MRARELVFTGILLASAALAPAAETFTYHHDHVLGTSLEIQVQADAESTSLAAEAKVLSEIERLAKIFSTYEASSEFSRWQAKQNQAVTISPELFEILAASDRWRKESNGAFEPAIAVLSNVWKQAEQRQSLPTDAELAAAVAEIKQQHWKLEKDGSATHLTKTPLTLNAIAKGAIVEWACQAACKSADVRGLVVNLGGDMRVCGDTVQEVRIADPLNDAENAAPLGKIFVFNRAVATSGNYRRGYKIAGNWYSHILDPRSGQPAGEVISATVVAESSAEADALATICNVLSVEESLALVKQTPGVECLLVTRQGKQYRSEGWDELTSPGLYRLASSTKAFLVAYDESTDSKKEDAAKDDNAKAPVELLELVVKFELNRPSGGQYRRPYVAVWLEDADGFPVRTAILWMQTKQPGPRWHRDLLRWHRNDGVRKLADDTELIGVISGATRGPGEYKAVFDGRDDAGKPLKAGKYTLFIEAVREHGTHQLISHPLTLGKESLEETKLKSNVEIKSASVEYRAAASEKDAQR